MNCLLPFRDRSRGRIPKGFRLKVRGCPARMEATLGKPTDRGYNPVGINAILTTATLNHN